MWTGLYTGDEIKRTTYRVVRTSELSHTSRQICVSTKSSISPLLSFFTNICTCVQAGREFPIIVVILDRLKTAVLFWGQFTPNLSDFIAKM